jgi:hypothetical protein
MGQSAKTGTARIRKAMKTAARMLEYYFAKVGVGYRLRRNPKLLLLSELPFRHQSRSLPKCTRRFGQDRWTVIHSQSNYPSVTVASGRGARASPASTRRV